MLGPPKARHVDRPVRVSLEDLVPAGHFSRHLEAALAWANRELRQAPERASPASAASFVPEMCVTHYLVGPSTCSAVGRGFESLPGHTLPDG
jgi:hypothetical protein